VVHVLRKQQRARKQQRWRRLRLRLRLLVLHLWALQPLHRPPSEEEEDRPPEDRQGTGDGTDGNVLGSAFFLFVVRHYGGAQLAAWQGGAGVVGATVTLPWHLNCTK
jgi:hypothetical protein